MCMVDSCPCSARSVRNVEPRSRAAARSDQDEGQRRGTAAFVSPCMTGSVLHDDVMLAQQLRASLVEFEPDFAVENDAVVDGRGRVHAVLLEKLRKPRADREVFSGRCLRGEIGCK